MSRPELLLAADQWGKRYGQRPSALLLLGDASDPVLAAALDLAAMTLAAEVQADQMRRADTVFPVVVLNA